MSHVIRNDPTFFCMTCRTRKPVAEKSDRRSGTTFKCKTCKAAIEAHLKARKKHETKLL